MKRKRILIILSISIILLIVIGIVIATIQKPKEIEKTLEEEELISDIIHTEDEKYAKSMGNDFTIEAQRKNQKESFYQEKQIEGLIYKNIIFVEDASIAMFEADVVNQTGNAINEVKKKVILLDENKEEIGTFIIYIDSLEEGKVRRVHTEIDTKKFKDKDILTASDFIVK